VPSAKRVNSPFALEPRSITAPVGTPPDCDTVPRMSRRIRNSSQSELAPDEFALRANHLFNPTPMAAHKVAFQEEPPPIFSPTPCDANGASPGAVPVAWLKNVVAGMS